MVRTGGERRTEGWNEYGWGAAGMIDSGQNSATQTGSPGEIGGVGGDSDRGDSGLTGVKEQRLIELALKRGWLKGQRWPTDATPNELEKTEVERDLTLRERAALAVMRDAAGGDPRIRQIAVRNAIAMEAQNQVDETPERKGQTLNVNVANAVQLYLPDNGRASPPIEQKDAH